MEPDLFLRKVSLLQVGMELRVDLGQGPEPSGGMQLSQNALTLKYAEQGSA